MAPQVKILLAEDETSLGLIIKESLESRDFEVHWYTDGNEAMMAAQKLQPDILVLDIMMPGKDGYDLAKTIRKKDQRVPIIFLTAKSRTEDVVEGFESGGNDYLKKPFSMEELIVRINELLKRGQPKESKEQIAIGKYLFNYPKQMITLGADQQRLTHREAEVLICLAARPNQLIDRSYMLNEIWGDDDFFSTRSMDVFITKLRKKFKEDPGVEIVNVRGFGYKLIC